MLYRRTADSGSIIDPELLTRVVNDSVMKHNLYVVTSVIYSEQILSMAWRCLQRRLVAKL